jgi:alkylhydroperoxidase family enzyme
LGQACGSAAVLAIDSDQTVQEVDYARLRERLLQDHQIIDANTMGMPDSK